MKIMKQLSFVLFLTCVLATVSFSQQPYRYWDDEVKRLIDEAVESSDDFQDEFENVKSITTVNGVQVDVEQYLEDYEDLFKRFRDDFDSKRIPSIDLVNLLRMTREIDGVMTRNPDAGGAGSEWQVHKYNVEQMARAFRTSIREGSPSPKRLSDKQVKELMEEVEEGSKALRDHAEDAAEDDKSLSEDTRDSSEQILKYMEKEAERMSDLFEDKKPFTIEMQEFFRQLDQFRSFLDEHSLGSEVQSDFLKLRNNADQLAAEYGF